MREWQPQYTMMVTAQMVKETVLRDILFADDCALTAVSELMPDSMGKLSIACDNFGLTSTTKTEVIHQPAQDQLYVKSSITVKDHKLPAIDKFTYLSSILSKAIHIDDLVNCRLPKPVSTLEDYVTLYG